MKKLSVNVGLIKLLSFLACMLSCSGIVAQIYYINENFNSLSAGNTLPSGWSNNLISGSASFDFFRFGQSGVFHSVGNPGTRTSGNAGITGICAIFDSDNTSSGGGLENVALESPSFNTTGAANVHVRWDQDYHGGYQSGDSINVEVFDGTSWIKVYENGAFSSSGGAAVQDSPDIDVTSVLANKTGAKVRFRYRGNWSWWWLFDNVQVYSIPPTYYFIKEPFTTASGSTPPSGWSNNLISGSSSFDFFRFGQSGIFNSVGNPGTRTSGNSNTAGTWAIFDSDNTSSGGGLENVALESPTVNTTGFSSNIHLKWDQDYHGGYQSGDSINVEVFDGTSWVKVYQNGAFSTSGLAAIQNSPDIDVTSVIANKSNVKVRFRFRANWSWWWIFDNVELYAPAPTPAPDFTINTATQCLPGNSFNFTNTSTIPGASSSMTYSWNFGDATNSSATNPSGKIYASANAYTVTLTATSDLGVAASTSKTATVNAVATPSVSVSPSPSNTVCDNQSVTFTATPTNGGTTPTYQWKKNGGNIATGATWNAGTSLVTGDAITCVMTSNYPCPAGGISTATSNTVNMTVNPVLTPSVSIGVSPGNSFCPGTNATFTATPTNGGTPAYQWKKNGSNVGTNSSAYSDNTLTTGDVITCVMTSSIPCPTSGIASSTSNGITINTSFPASVTIAPNTPTTVCSGTSVTFTATPTNGGTAAYQWKRNGINVGVNANTYTVVPGNGDVVSVQMTSSIACASPKPATSNTVTINHSVPVTPSVTVAKTPNTPICTGTPVTFSATPVNGGATPSYQWKVNGVNVGTNSSGYADAGTLANGDVVSVVMTSSLCASPPTATDNTTMVVNAILTPSVSISSNATSNTACAGTNVTFTAVPVNGGTTPAYQWKKNGSNVGTNSTTYSDAGLVNGDQITCQMTSNYSCPTGGIATATSGTVTMIINPLLNSSVSISNNVSSNIACAGANVTFTAVSINGGTSPVYQWKKNGSNVGTNSITYSDAGLANGDQITCQMTSNAICPSATIVISNTITMTINPIPSVTTSTAATICSDATTNIGLTATIPSFFTWTLGTNTGNISGAYNASATTISQTLTNPSAITTGSIVYVVVPISMASSCLGPATNITVTVNPKPLLTNTTASVCSGVASTMPITSSMASTLTWAVTTPGTITGATTGTNQANFTQTLTNPSSTTAANIVYSITPTSTVSGSCAGNATAVTVTVNPKPVFTNTTPTFCTGSTAAIAVGPSIASTLTWTVTTPGTIMGSAAGTNQAAFTQTLTNPSITTPAGIVYSVTPTATVLGACVGNAANITVTVYPIPDVTTVTNKTVCNNNTVAAINFSSTVSGTNFTWSNNNNFIGLGSSGAGNISSFTGTNAFTTPISGTVTVIPTAGGCTGSQGTFTITVNPTPTVNAISNQSLCSGKTTNPLFMSSPVSGTSFAWSNNNTSTGLAASGTGNINSFTAVNTGTTVATSVISITPAANGCTGPTSITNVSVLPLPDTTITKSGNTKLCPGDTLTLTAPAAASYLWGNGATTQFIKVAQAGNYFVTATGVNACVNSSSVVAVSVFPYPDTSITFSGTAFCAQDSLKLTVNNAASVNWNTGATTKTLTVYNSGTFYAMITDANSCTAKSSIFNLTFYALPAVDAGLDASVEIGYNYSLGHYPLATGNWPFTYAWTPCNGSFNCTQQHPFITMDTAVITYCVTVTDVKGCKSSDCVTLTPLPKATGIAVNDHSIDIKAYPNPFDDIIHIEGTDLEDGEYKYELVNELGAYVKQGYWKISDKALHEQITISGLAAATYNLTIQHNNLSQTFRLVNR
jgi:hypothetical protein